MHDGLGALGFAVAFRGECRVAVDSGNGGVCCLLCCNAASSRVRGRAGGAVNVSVERYAVAVGSGRAEEVGHLHVCCCVGGVVYAGGHSPACYRRRLDWVFVLAVANEGAK